MKIKYIGGKKADQIADIDEAQAKGLIEEGYAEAVVEKSDAVADIEKALDARDAALKADFTKALDDRDARIGKAVAKARPHIVVGAERIDADPQAGFKNVGDYLLSIVKAGRGQIDARLERLNKTVAPQNETTGADGGYAVPTQYADFLYYDIMNDEDNLLSRSFNIPVSLGSAITVPCDNTTVLGSNGITATVISEGSAIADSKAAIRQITFNLKKLGALVDVTEELLADTNVALPAYLSAKTKNAFDYAINDGFLNGGQSFAVGVTGHAATNVVAKDSGQAAASITYPNLCNIRKGFYGDRKQACWIMGPDTEAAVMQVQDGAGRNIYFPPGGLKDQPYGTLFGMPVVISYHAAVLGTVGDITLGDWSKYFVAVKGGMDSASTPFLHWDQQLMSFRTVLRLYGRPERAATLATAGGLTLSPFVQLATRS